jgi:hypothetical protein
MTELTTIQMEIKYIKEKLENMPTRDEMKLANEQLVDRVLESCDKRYAPKWVQSAITYIASIVAAWIVYYVLNGA